MKYWLMKSEPSDFSIDDLKKNKISHWDGVRNYQARNFMKDMKLGDKILFYHSNTNPIGVVGTAEVSKLAYPDHTAYDKKDPHYDPKSKQDSPTWYMVNIRFVSKFKKCVTLSHLRSIPSLENMMILRKGNRLSITPINKKEFDTIINLSNE